MRTRRLGAGRALLRARPGKVLVLTVMALPPMLGMLGMVIDGGILLASHRQAQNAADAAAVAAAWDMLRGRPSGTWTTTATTYVQQYEGLANGTVAVNNPPQSGYFSTVSASTSYIEAIVTVPTTMMFLPAVGVGRSQQ